MSSEYISDAELAEWAELRADDAGRLARELIRYRWKTIDSAPRDGTEVHVISTKWLLPVPAAFSSRAYFEKEYGDPDYMKEGWYPSYGFLFDLPEVTINPTHWMPLPTPPEAGTVNEGEKK